MAITKTATLIKLLNRDQALFHIHPFSVYYGISVDYGNGIEKEHHATNYVVCSKALIMESYYETYLFPANADGEILSFGELEGSLKNVYDFVEPFVRLGYEVIIPPAYKVLFQK